MALSKTDVETAFQWILGREPENSNVVQHFRSVCGSPQELRDILINSPEFHANTGVRLGAAETTLVEKRINQEIEIEHTPQQLQKVWDKIGRSWEKLGQDQPFHSVVTSDAYLPENIKEHEESFWETGTHDTDKIKDICQSCGIDLGSLKSALEYGCGVGRASMFLASIFDTVHALDISKNHLAIAKQRSAQLKIENIHFNLVTISSFDNLPHYDFFYSRIVLQHNPPPIMSYILKKLLNKLPSGGVGIFQIPVYMDGYRFELQRYLTSSTPDLEMHCLPQAHILALIADAGCIVREVREDGDIGKFGEWVSNTIAVQKQ